MTTPARVRNYQFGLLPPTVNAGIVDDEMRMAHRYRNQLVEIERERRTRIREALSGTAEVSILEQKLASAVARRDAARLELAARRKATRSRSDSPEERSRVRDLGVELRLIREQIKAARVSAAVLNGVLERKRKVRKLAATARRHRHAGRADDLAVTRDLLAGSWRDLRDHLAQIRREPSGEEVIQVARAVDAASQHAYHRTIQARDTCAVYWGSYLLVEQAMDAARSGVSPPDFKPYRGEGRVSVQLQGGIGLGELIDDTQMQIVHMDDPRRGRRSGQRRILRLRVGSDGRRRPIWAEWPMTMHRELPLGARVKVATVSRRRQDVVTWRWQLLLTVDESACAPRPVRGEGAVALNLGYCRRPDDGVRAGYVVGSDGYESEVLVRDRVVGELARADDIRAIRDRRLNEARAQLSEWRARHAEAQGDHATPAWFTEQTRTLHAWRSPGALRRLFYAWRDRRWVGDEYGFEVLAAWRYKDDHLDRYENGARSHAQRSRQDAYRQLAARLAAQYRYLIVDDTDLRDLQRSPSPESEDVEIRAVKYRQRVAAGSVLRGALTSAFGPDRTLSRSAVDVTRRCSSCLAVNDWDRSSGEREHTCVGCGRRRDQDANAGENLLRDWQRLVEEKETAHVTASTTRKPSRSERLRASRDLARSGRVDGEQTVTEGG
jgi:hypothetical protein